ncbi:MAG: MBL fold metallo-hydrolase, partial [Candidatus Thermoplasmatota archaeon]|nr:MBL fold metallo-hydrolase [Candidatus Thermoplasmatota archaeon]
TSIEATPAVHSDPTTIGFRLATGAGVVSYTSDTVLDPEVVYSHKKARVLIMSVTRPFDAPIPHHLHTGDAIEFVEKARPEMAVFTHFGMKFEEGVAEKEALMVQNQTGVKTIAAADGMVIQLGRDISVQK